MIFCINTNRPKIPTRYQPGLPLEFPQLPQGFTPRFRRDFQRVLLGILCEI